MTTRTFARARLPAGDTRYAEITGNTVALLTAAPWLGGEPEGPQVKLSDVTLTCPVEASKIIGIGRNYRAHAAELGHDLPSEPLMFLKPPSSLQGPGVPVQLPVQSERVDFEAELGVVIGKRTRNVAAKDALAHVFGYTIVCDVTARDLQNKDGQWTRSKGFDTFCPVGPWIVPGLDPDKLQIQLRQNGELKQDGNTADMIFPVARLIAHASSVMTLEPGDLIATGTPHGVGPMQPGDRIAISLPEVGELSFPVIAAAS